jgi:hypothetical protein
LVFVKKPPAKFCISRPQYILRSPFSPVKMVYHKESEAVLYRSKMNPNLKRNFALFPVLDWIAKITAHIPNKGEQLVRYYGAYSNASTSQPPEPPTSRVTSRVGPSYHVEI